MINRYNRLVEGLRAYLVRIHCLDRLSVGQDLAGRVALKELDSLVPLMHSVGILAQHDATQQLRPALHQVLESSNPELTGETGLLVTTSQKVVRDL